jgi:hypothetical protein
MADAKTFYIWATLLSDRAASDLTAGLVRKGFHVGALAANNNLTIVGNVCALASLKAVTDTIPEKLPEKLPEKDTTVGWVLERVKEVLNHSENSWLSLVVSELGGSCTWSGSNVAKKKEDPPPKKEDPTVLDKMDKTLGG